MFNSIVEFLNLIDGFFWGCIAFALIMILGSFLTIQNSFFQIREIPKIGKTFFGLIGKPEEDKRGVHPLKVFFASTGGMIGVGNIVGIATAVQLGGPGALLWVWIAGMIGAIVKYGEIYLGLKYRVPNERGGYDGGPMYFLKKVFKNKWIPTLVALLLCVYGIEVYQFTVITESISTNWHVNRFLVMAVLLALVMYASLGGVKRIGQICSWVMPFFLVIFIIMAAWVLLSHASALPALFANVFKSGFTGHAAIGGFAGSTVMMTIQHGIARAAYSADIGVGYDSIIQSETTITKPERQARLAIFGVFIDNLICTLSILVILVSGIWTSNEAIPGSHLVQMALANYFPAMDLFMTLFLTIVGFTTIIAFFCVGIKCASYLAPRMGRKIYPFIGAGCFIGSTFIDQSHALLVMSLSGALLLIINLIGIFALRKEISYSSSSELKVSEIEPISSKI